MLVALNALGRAIGEKMPDIPKVEAPEEWFFATEGAAYLYIDEIDPRPGSYKAEGVRYPTRMTLIPGRFILADDGSLVRYDE